MKSPQSSYPHGGTGQGQVLCMHSTGWSRGGHFIRGPGWALSAGDETEDADALARSRPGTATPALRAARPATTQATPATPPRRRAAAMLTLCQSSSAAGPRARPPPAL